MNLQTMFPTSDESAAVWARYWNLLERAASPLVDSNQAVRTQLRHQVDAVLTAVARNLGLQDPGTTTLASDNLSETIGRARALEGVHPADSLAAAAFIFEAALPTVTRWVRPNPDTAGEKAATTLNSEILRRMSLASRAYVDLLLERIHDSNQLERRSLSRGLHDVIAPAVALGIQHLELYEAYRTTEPTRAANKITDARQSMVDAITAIRGLSQYLRVDIAEQGLTAAIRDFLHDTPDSVNGVLRVQGQIDDLPPAYAQEVFLIVREAIRNAVNHAEPTRIDVDLELTRSRILAIVADDGNGFDLENILANRHHVGLDSMRERAEVLSGTLQVKSSSKNGTTVLLNVPHSVSTHDESMG